MKEEEEEEGEEEGEGEEKEEEEVEEEEEEEGKNRERTLFTRHILICGLRLNCTGHWYPSDLYLQSLISECVCVCVRVRVRVWGVCGCVGGREGGREGGKRDREKDRERQLILSLPFSECQSTSLLDPLSLEWREGQREL